MVSLPVPPSALLGELPHHISVASDRQLWFSCEKASFGADSMGYVFLLFWSLRV